MAFAGKLSFNPITDTLRGADGIDFMLDPPSGDELPQEGFASGK
jgi:aconitate hydratase